MLFQIFYLIDDLVFGMHNKTKEEETKKKNGKKNFIAST